MTASIVERESFLVCRVGALACAVPLRQVIETMRPLPTETMSGAPAFVTGLALIRGEAVPVVDAGLLVGGCAGEPTRLVTLRVGGRTVALAVDLVVGVVRLLPSSLGELPPLLEGADVQSVSSVGRLDAELLVVLQSGRILPESTWAELAPRESQL